MEEFVYTGRGQTVPKDVVRVRFDPSVTEVEEDAFIECTRLREIVFNEGLKKIGIGAFCGCRSLLNFVLPSSLTDIDDHAFDACLSLTHVVFSEGLQKIGNSSFLICKSLESVTCSSTMIEIGESVFSGCNFLEEVVLKDGLKKIGSCAFEQCSSLQSISLPSTITEIGNNGFKECNSLEVITLNEGLEKIGDEAFKYCCSLEYIALPSTLVEIGREAFSICSHLREVRLHENLESIGNCAFAHISSLERFNFPNISNRLNIIMQTGHYPIVEAKIDEVRGDFIERRGNELFVPGAVLVLGGDTRGGSSWNPIKASLDQIVSWIRYYEIKEASTLFELALWKAKLDQEEAHPINRMAYRIEVPGPVKDAILQYL